MYKQYLLFIFLFLHSLYLFSGVLQAQAPSANGSEYFLRAEEYRVQQQYQHAISAYENAIKADPSNHKYFLQKGKCYYNLKDIDKAIYCLEKAAKLERKQVDAYVGLSQLYKEKGQDDKVIYYLHQASIYDDDVSKKLDYKLRVLQILYHKNAYKEALTHIREAYALDTNDPELLYYAAWASNQDKQYQKAVQAILQATPKIRYFKPQESAKYYYQLGYAYHHLAAYDKAKEAFEKASYGSLKASVARFMPEHQCKLAYAYQKVYDMDKTNQYLKQALKMDAQMPQAKKLLLQIEQNNATEDMLAAMIRSAEMERNEDEKVRRYSKVLDIYMSKGNYKEALEVVNSCLEIQPARYDLRFVRAIAVYKIGNKEQGISELYQLAHLSVLSSELRSLFCFSLGLLYKEQGDNKNAYNYFKKATAGVYRVAALEELAALQAQ
ncbi:MAG: tetratricopeptide repeat protein [Bernardetiaceae bacterium]|nr:tetratricopeptide repeat protein [Bernardetiaceae bacterium]